MKRLILAGLVTAFGSVAAQAQDEGMPPPETSIYFESNSSELGQAAQEILQVLARRYRSQGNVTFLLIGHTDSALPSRDSLILSARMTNAVATHLIGLGFSENDIKLVASGESELAKPTADGVREPINRRVDVYVGF